MWPSRLWTNSTSTWPKYNNKVQFMCIIFKMHSTSREMDLHSVTGWNIVPCRSSLNDIVWSYDCRIRFMPFLRLINTCDMLNSYTSFSIPLVIGLFPSKFDNCNNEQSKKDILSILSARTKATSTNLKWYSMLYCLLFALHELEWNIFSLILTRPIATSVYRPLVHEWIVIMQWKWHNVW